MANSSFVNQIYLNGASLYGTPESSSDGTMVATDTIIENNSTETLIGSSYGKTILHTDSGVINFYVSNDTGYTRKAIIDNTGNMNFVDEGNTTVGYALATNDDGTIANHNILTFNFDDSTVYVGSGSSYVPQTIIYSNGPIKTPNGIYMNHGEYIFGLGSSSYNDTDNIFDNDVNTTFLIGMTGGGNIFINDQRNTKADDSARTDSKPCALYGKEIFFYIGSYATFACTSSEVLVNSNVSFQILEYNYAASSLSFTIDSTNVSTYSGGIKVIKSLRMCVCTLLVKMNTTYSANTPYNIATLSSSSYAPSTLAALNAIGYNGSGSAVAKATGYINSSGVISFKQRVVGSSGHTIAVTGCWFYEKVVADPGDI